MIGDLLNSKGAHSNTGKLLISVDMRTVTGYFHRVTGKRLDDDYNRRIATHLPRNEQR